MNIVDILCERARTHGDRLAIVERGRTITFAELDEAATSAAAELASAALTPGMRAIMLSPMSIDLYIALIGMFRLQVAPVFVDPAHLAACIARLQPDAFVAVRRAHLLRLTTPAVRAIPIKLTVARVARARRSREIGRGEPCAPDTPAIVTFTSGSTGDPKAVVRSHGFLLSQHRALATSLALEPGETDLTALPIVLLANLASGVTSIIPDADLRAPGAIRPEPVLDQIRRLRPSRTIASPALLERLAACASRRGERFDSLQRIFTGGAPVFPALLDRLAAVAPGASIVSVYGSTEAEPIASIDAREIGPADRSAMRHGAGVLAGTSSSSIEVRILPDRWGIPITPGQADLDREALVDGGIGEIVVSGAHVLGGYLDGAGDEETKIHAGGRIWHRTGDAGYFDRQGRLWLLGRCAAKVTDHDGTLYPLAVECAASDVPGLRRSAFVRHQGRRVLVAEVEDGVGQSGPQMRDLLLRRLAWARLAEVRIVSRVPVDPRHNAKTDYPALSRLLGEA
jgi:acyl-CoA synthetase (AMP-forming)/AMP-acid ligase II